MAPSPAKNVFCVDLPLAQRLERAEALANRRYIEAKQKAYADSSADWIEVVGAYALFDSPLSPLTQTFGLGVFETPTPQHLAELEEFFISRGASVNHEISPLADLSLLALLHERGYRPVEVTAILARPSADLPPIALNPRITVREVGKGEQDAYIRLAAEAWNLPPEFDSFFAELAQVNRFNPHVVHFFAELDGQPVGCGGLCLSDGVALIAGDSTLPAARGHGAQQALIAARIEYARRRGDDLVMMGALPGSTSQKNGQRCGLQICYTRIKWEKSPSSS